MNRIVFTLSLLGLLSLNSLHLQAQKLHFGLAVTPSFNWLNVKTNGWDGDGNLFRFGYGLMAEIAINDEETYMFGTGLEFSYTGGKVKYDYSSFGVPVSGSADIRIQNLDIPLTLKLKTADNGTGLRYFGRFGVVSSFRLNAEIEGDNVETSLTDQTSAFNVLLTVGAGVEYQLSGTTYLHVEPFFSNGFINIIDENDIDADAGELNEAFQQRFGIRAGILF